MPVTGDLRDDLAGALRDVIHEFGERRATIGPHDLADAVLQMVNERIEAGREGAAEAITVPRPHIPHGPEHLDRDTADAQYLRKAADDIETYYQPFGSNVRASVVKLLRDAADAIDPARVTAVGTPKVTS